jgi:aryl-alcohol dehydrogenase-like predicted oxidoreductase
MCHFYEDPRDLVDAVVPYFLTGLERKERCIWLGSPPLGTDSIKIEVSKRPTLDRAVESGQLLVVDAAEWYRELDAEALIKRWFDEEELALSNGYCALRIAGNTGFLPRDGWNSFIEFERKFHSRIRNRRIVACCSYHSLRCEPVDVLEVVRCHDAALDRSDEAWDLSLSAASAGSWAQMPKQPAMGASRG